MKLAWYAGSLAYYASITLDALSSLLCPELCWHNKQNPMQNPGQTRIFYKLGRTRLTRTKLDPDNSDDLTRFQPWWKTVTIHQNIWESVSVKIPPGKILRYTVLISTSISTKVNGNFLKWYLWSWFGWAVL